MGVTNYDFLLENQAASLLKEAAQTASERKAMQRVGSYSVRYYRTDSAGAWLWSGRLDTQSAQSTSTGFARFLIVLTSTTSAAFLSSCVVEVEESTDGVTWTPQRPITSPFGFNWELQEAGVVGAEPYKAKYDLFLQGGYDQYRRYKVQALSSDPVSISYVRTL